MGQDGQDLRRERALKVVVGVIFSALVYPLTIFVQQEPALAMMLSRLIAFTAWSSFAHAAVMGMQAFCNWVARGELIGVAALVVIGVALITLSPAKTAC